MKICKILLLLFVPVSLASCSKDKDVVGLEPTGYWEGVSGPAGQTPSFDVAFLLRNNGTLRLYYEATDTATSEKAEGIYSVSGRAINGSYNFIDPTLGTYTFTAQVASGDTTMTGTYSGDGSAMGMAGDFILLKQ